MEITAYFRTTKLSVPKLISSLHCGSGLASIDGVEQVEIDVPIEGVFGGTSSTTLIAQTAGDSMMPTFTHGDRIVVNTKAQCPQDGDVVVAYCNASHMVKRYRVVDGKAYLSSDNKDYQPIPIDDDIVIFGKVVHRIQEIKRELI